MKEIKIGTILTLLEEGKTRKEIAEHLQISLSDLKTIFSHPKLKGKRQKKQKDYVLVDDTEDIVDTSATDDDIIHTDENMSTVPYTVDNHLNVENVLLTDPISPNEEELDKKQPEETVAWVNG